MLNNLLIIVPFLAVIGFQLVLLGRRGRRSGDMRVCNQCDYILVEGEDATRCAECGMVLEGQPVIRGQKKPRTGLVAAGCLLIAIGVLGMTGSFMGLGFNAHLPVGVLTWMAGDGNTGAMTELTRRILARAISKEDCQSLAAKALAIQADESISRFDRDDWIDMLEVMDIGGLLTRDERSRYYEQCVRNLAIEAPERMMSTQLMEVHVAYDGAMPTRGATAKVVDEQVTIDGEVVDDSDLDSESFTESSVRPCNAYFSLKTPLPPGRHHVRFTAALEITRAKALMTKWILDKEVDILVEDHAWSRLGTEFEVADEALRNAIKPEVHEDAPVQGRRFKMRGRNSVTFFVKRELPVTVAFEIVAITPDGERVIGTLAGEKGDDRFKRTWSRGGPPFELQEVDVILRPNLDVARSRGYAEIYPKEIRAGKMRLGQWP